MIQLTLLGVDKIFLFVFLRGLSITLCANFHLDWATTTSGLLGPATCLLQKMEAFGRCLPTNTTSEIAGYGAMG